MTIANQRPRIQMFMSQSHILDKAGLERVHEGAWPHHHHTWIRQGVSAHNELPVKNVIGIIVSELGTLHSRASGIHKLRCAPGLTAQLQQCNDSDYFPDTELVWWLYYIGLIADRLAIEPRERAGSWWCTVIVQSLGKKSKFMCQINPCFTLGA